MTQPISIMPCMDMQDGRVVKGVHFVDIKDAGDPVQCAEAYCKAGADELALLDYYRELGPDQRAALLETLGRMVAPARQAKTRQQAARVGAH